jgi:hypothetical protein
MDVSVYGWEKFLPEETACKRCEKLKRQLTVMEKDRDELRFALTELKP